MASDTISLSALREQAKSLRARADEIDALVDEVQRVMSGLVVPEGAVEAARRPVKALPSDTSASPTAPRGGSKGKPPGTMNMTWRENFARIADVSGRDEFPLDLVRDVVSERTGRNDLKLSGLRRQFNNYIEHGYVTSDADDHYRLTDKLLNLIGRRDSDQHDRNETAAAEAAAGEEGAPTPSANDSREDIFASLG